MANSETIKTTIDVNINTNGNQAITGAVMNSVLKQMVDSADTELAKLSEETNARFAESAESTSKRIIALENKADNKFADVDSEIENLKRGEAYVMGESLVFRNYADAKIIGNTLTL